MKKLLIMTDTLGGGGAEKVLVNILKRLDYEIFEVTLCLIFKQGIYIEELPEKVKLKAIFEGYEYAEKLSFIKKILYKIYMKVALCLLRISKGRPLYKFLIKEKFDIEISFLEGDSCLFVSNSKNKNSKKISWIHTDLEKRKTIKRSKEKDSLTKMDKIICVSEGSRQSVLNLYPELSRKIEVVYNAIDTKDIIEKSYQQIDFKKKNTTLLSIGKLHEPKGFDILINAHKELIDEGINHTMVIIGEGPMKESLELQIKKMELSESVVLTGFLKNPYPYIKKSDIFVVPSRYEGFSLVLVEAMILGKAIIATKCMGPLELLEGKYGYLVDVENKENLKAAMKKMILDLDFRNGFAAQAKIGSKKFDITETMKIINNILIN